MGGLKQQKVIQAQPQSIREYPNSINQMKSNVNLWAWIMNPTAWIKNCVHRLANWEFTNAHGSFFFLSRGSGGPLSYSSGELERFSSPEPQHSKLSPEYTEHTIIQNTHGKHTQQPITHTQLNNWTVVNIRTLVLQSDVQCKIHILNKWNSACLTIHHQWPWHAVRAKDTLKIKTLHNRAIRGQKLS